MNLFVTYYLQWSLVIHTHALAVKSTNYVLILRKSKHLAKIDGGVAEYLLSHTSQTSQSEQGLLVDKIW